MAKAAKAKAKASSKKGKVSVKRRKKPKGTSLPFAQLRPEKDSVEDLPSSVVVDSDLHESDIEQILETHEVPVFTMFGVDIELHRDLAFQMSLDHTMSKYFNGLKDDIPAGEMTLIYGYCLTATERRRMAHRGDLPVKTREAIRTLSYLEFAEAITSERLNVLVEAISKLPKE